MPTVKSTDETFEKMIKDKSLIEMWSNIMRLCIY